VRERIADRPPRPLADAPIASLTDAADDLARDWLVELVARLPLADVTALGLAPLVADGPALCRAVVAALAADDALAALRRGGGHEALLTGVTAAAASGELASIPAVVESLRRVVWSAALPALGVRPSSDLVAALSDRLAHVCATVTATALGAPADVDADADADAGAGALVDADAHPGADAEVAEPTRPDFIVHDTRGAGVDGAGAREDEAESAEDGVEAAEDGVEAADAGRGDWTSELLDALAGDAARSLMLVDVDGHERLLAADGRSALRRAERGLVRNLVDDATMVRESLGRYWVVSGCGDDEDSAAFAGRLAEAVATGAGHLGVPLTASIGISLLDTSGAARGKRVAVDEPLAVELRERAEEAMLSARAAGAGIDIR
jgi:GGDEF domain-containing protein